MTERSFTAIHLAHRAAHAARLLAGMQGSANNRTTSDDQQYD